MKKSVLILVQMMLWGVMPCTTLAATLTAATPQAVSPSVKITLYAAGASVTETRQLAIRDGVTRFTLPAAADPQSLRVMLPETALTDMHFTSIPAEDTGEQAGALRAVRRDIVELSGKIDVLKARQEYWMRAVDGSGGEARVPENEFTGHIASLTRQIQEVQAALDEARKTQARLEELQQTRGVSGTVTEVTARVTSQGSSTTSSMATLSYRLDACGWRPLTRLDALTGQQAIDLSRLAVIEQKTGMDWTNVELTLSTAATAVRVEPPRLGNWRIEPVRAAAPLPAGNGAATLELRADAVPVAARSPMSIKQAAPVFTEEASSGYWDLGMRNIPAGSPVLVPLESRQWPAQFVRLIRPVRQEVAYLVGQVSLPDSLYIPTESAQYFVDGVFVGTGNFGFSGKQRDIAFGPDPAVTASMTADTAQSGTHGFAGRRQSYDWCWTITVRNAHDKPVKVRVEDALPQAGDSDITLKIQSSPEAQRDEQTLVWNLTVPAGGEERLRHEVSFEAPADMPITPGR